MLGHFKKYKIHANNNLHQSRDDSLKLHYSSDATITKATAKYFVFTVFRMFRGIASHLLHFGVDDRFLKLCVSIEDLCEISNCGHSRNRFFIYVPSLSE